MMIVSVRVKQYADDVNQDKDENGKSDYPFIAYNGHRPASFSGLVAYMMPRMPPDWSISRLSYEHCHSSTSLSSSETALIPIRTCFTDRVCARALEKVDVVSLDLCL